MVRSLFFVLVVRVVCRYNSYYYDSIDTRLCVCQLSVRMQLFKICLYSCMSADRELIYVLNKSIFKYACKMCKM
jgi:hypothetical protein